MIKEIIKATILMIIACTIYLAIYITKHYYLIFFGIGINIVQYNQMKTLRDEYLKDLK